MYWKLVIYNSDGTSKEIPLNSEYETADDAAREAEHIADLEFSFSKLAEDWTVMPVEVPTAS